MAKRKTRAKPAPAAKKKEEGRTSFLPDEKPEKEPEPQPIIEAEVKLEPKVVDDNAGEPEISMKIAQSQANRYEFSLTIAPLEPAVEPLPIASNASPEQRAAIIAGVIQRAAQSLVSDGTYQHYEKKRQEDEAKERFSKRA